MGSTASATGADGRLSDAARLRRLGDTGLLDSGPSASLDRLARAAAHQLRTSRAQVSLVADDRRVVAGSAGPPAPHTFCRLVVDSDAPLIFTDARVDDRVAGHPAIDDGVIAYAGFPIRSLDGYPLGAFCVLHDEPRDWEPRDLLLVEDLAAVVEAEIAMRAEVRAHASTARRLQTVLDACQDAYVSIDTTGVVTSWNAAAEGLFGFTAAEALGTPVANLIIPPRFRAAHTAGLARINAGGQTRLSGHRIELTARNRAGHEFPIEMTLQVDAFTFHAFLHDISGRVADRRQLEHERTFLQALLDSLDVGVAACDADGRPTLFNHAMREIKSGEHGLCSPDGAPLDPGEAPLARAFRGEIVDRQHVVVVPPGGAPQHFHANARRIETPDGQRIGAVVALHDITDQRVAERSRDVRYAVARALADAESAEEAAGRTVAAVARALGWVYGEFWQTDEEAGVINRVGHWSEPGHDLGAVTDGRPFSVDRGVGLAGHIWLTEAELFAAEAADDARLLTRADQIRAAGLHSALGVPVRSGDRILGVLLLFSADVQEYDADVSDLLELIGAQLGRYLERRRSEDLALALAAARRDFDRVIEQVNDYVWTVEVRPDRTIGSIYASPDGSGVFGEELTIEWDMAAAMHGRVHPDDQEAYDEFVAKVMDGQPAENEIRLIGTDGVTRWVWTRAMPRREGRKLLLDGISTNVTERHLLADQREKLLTDQRAQNEKLRRVDRLKDELVALVSHELRNPLGAIRSYTETLLDEPDLTADQRHLAEVIDRRSADMQAMVDDLLDLARIEAGQLHLEARPLSMTRLIRDVLQGLQPAADAKDLVVEVAGPRELLAQADPMRLRQVLDNLVSNAIKYTPAGGRVTVTARHDPPPPGNMGDGDVTIEVTDTGIGIPADQYPHLFDRFFRASNAVQQGIKGTGLGLAITKAIVDAHGGTLTAGPAPDSGCTFTVRLPAL
ncbi:ATP-binding protein [Actinoplanes sp. NPDC026619]|uniref:PAS domain-containing sensor histidine kinase n=1 Tax=Actinoplanes sp. NPDC026619 TaxID=3155798 RepID=UPI003410F45F